MNVTIDELKIQFLQIRTKVRAELELSKVYYDTHAEERFGIEDHYLKFLLFTIYRGIEDFIKIIIYERITNSEAKDLYELINEKNLKSSSYFIHNDLMEIILKEIINNVNISYIQLFELISNEEISSTAIKVIDITEIKPSKKGKNSNVEVDFLIGIYNSCLKNRNKLMHSTITSIDINRNAILNSFIIYGFMALLLKNLFEN